MAARPVNKIKRKDGVSCKTRSSVMTTILILSGPQACRISETIQITIWTSKTTTKRMTMPFRIWRVHFRWTRRKFHCSSGTSVLSNWLWLKTNLYKAQVKIKTISRLLLIRDFLIWAKSKTKRLLKRDLAIIMLEIAMQIYLKTSQCKI